MLEFRNVSFSFSGRRGDVEVLHDVSFSCQEDEIVAVIGPSGCGKTTLLGLASALRTPTAGAVLVDGQVVKDPSRLIGMLFQQSTLLPWRSVVENVELGLEIRGEAQERSAAKGAHADPPIRAWRVRTQIPSRAFRRHAEAGGARANPGDGARSVAAR